MTDPQRNSSANFSPLTSNSTTPTLPSPITDLTHSIIEKACSYRASDIHIEPFKDRTRIRFRIDGALQEIQIVPKNLQTSLINQIKILAGTLNIAEKRHPQDGHIHSQIETKSIHLRVSTIPTIHGESIVLRILDNASFIRSLPELGLTSHDQITLQSLVNLPDGLILVTGPTGSGKTTTLYACLNAINTPNHKLISIEDPIECQLTGVNQIQVNPQIGMTFPAALRSILRQAPNVIMIGEIRDEETAHIAINASLTGHLVLSTLHTNDATSTITRLIDIGIKPYLLASSLRAVIAQRLVRHLCPHCKQPAMLPTHQRRFLNLPTPIKTMNPIGCHLCNQKGYKGRLGLFEILTINDELRHAINSNTHSHQLHHLARHLGMRNLHQDGIEKIVAGLTTPEEILFECGVQNSEHRATPRTCPPKL